MPILILLLSPFKSKAKGPSTFLPFLAVILLYYKNLFISLAEKAPQNQQTETFHFL